MKGRALAALGLALVLGGAASLAVAGVLATKPASLVAVDPAQMMSGWSGSDGLSGSGYGSGGMGRGMAGRGMMSGGMMSGAWSNGPGATSAGPGDAGFVAGTPSAPRLVRIDALPTLRFSPDVVRVQAGETIRFEITTAGPVAHEFMVGPAADVAADKDGTPEVADIEMMQTKTLDYTFAGSGPYAFACHAPGHYEAGMAGTIEVVN